MVGSHGFIMETTGDKLTKTNSQQSDLYNYNLDHVYCSDNSRYRNASTHINLAAAANDLKSLRKENKQLQAMLLLHLDLIQEQSNQLIAKDKQLLQLREENAQLRLKCERIVTPTPNERRQNNNRYHATATTTAAHSSGKLLNTSGGSPTIDSYFTTTNESKVSVHRSSHPSEMTLNAKNNKTQNIITNQNNPLNNNCSGIGLTDENQAINEIRGNQTTIPIKIEMNTATPTKSTTDESKIHPHALSEIVTVKQNRLKAMTPTSNHTIQNRSPPTIKYRAIENNIIGNNNGKLISKIILQRKKSENGEKIFVRTKNIDISNNKVNYEKWSPLRTIKSENDIEPKVLETITTMPTTTKTTTTTIKTMGTITPSPCVTPMNDDEMSSDAMETSYVAPEADNDEDDDDDEDEDMSPAPSVKTSFDQHSKLTTHSQINAAIKVEQERMHEDEDGQDDDDDTDEDQQQSPVYNPNSANEDSQDTSNIESPLTNESIPALVIPKSTASTCDFNQSESFARHCLNINSVVTPPVAMISASIALSASSAIAETAKPTILYPLSRRHIARNTFITTKKPYKIREWQLDEIEAELKQEITDEICKNENDSNLELPKWRTWEMSSNREAPVTAREWEDLSDDVFARRHARFLLDERKRKKWDVQRIREQRTIERLKRRHCKDELNQQINFNEISTFFPTIDQLKTISITDDLPVTAFGESVPMMFPGEFALPWRLHQSNMIGASFSLAISSSNINDPIPKSAFHSRSNSNCSSVSFETTAIAATATVPATIAPTNTSSFIYLAKKRAGRRRISVSHAIQHSNTKGNT